MSDPLSPYRLQATHPETLSFAEAHLVAIREALIKGCPGCRASLRDGLVYTGVFGFEWAPCQVCAPLRALRP